MKINNKSGKEKDDAYSETSGAGDKSVMYLPLSWKIEEPILADFHEEGREPDG
tara:strand:+ start:72 stop:230 length:159 start_codon:yes stop_codon:yes gene_type:complete